MTKCRPNNLRDWALKGYYRKVKKCDKRDVLYSRSVVTYLLTLTVYCSTVRVYLLA